MGIIGSLLAACGLGPRADVDAVRAALQEATAALPEHLGGTVSFQDSASTGTTIGGILTLAGTGRAEVEQSLLAVLEAVSAAYAAQPGVRTAFVRIEGHPEGDRNARVLSADVVPPATGANTTTEDLTARFSG